MLFEWLPTKMGRIWVRFLGFHRASVSTYHVFIGIRKNIPPSGQIRKRLFLWVEKLENDIPSSGWMQQRINWVSTSLSSHGWKPFCRVRPGQLCARAPYLHNINSASCCLVTKLNFNEARRENMHIFCIIPPWITCDTGLIWTSSIWDRVLNDIILRLFPLLY